jgi:hypothetical protein
MRKLMMLAATLLVGSLAIPSQAFASQPDYLSTPGTCVEDGAPGQTAKGTGEGGYHKFHDNVHKGQPGTEAFEKENNPVSMDKGSCPARQ